MSTFACKAFFEHNLVGLNNPELRHKSPVVWRHSRVPLNFDGDLVIVWRTGFASASYAPLLESDELATQKATTANLRHRWRCPPPIRTKSDGRRPAITLTEFQREKLRTLLARLNASLIGQDLVDRSGGRMVPARRTRADHTGLAEDEFLVSRPHRCNRNQTNRRKVRSLRHEAYWWGTFTPR
jgi:hypothetical protein